MLSFYNSTSDSLQSITGIGASHQPSAKPDFIAELSGRPYVGIVGYTSQGSHSSIYSVTTTIQLVGSSSYLGSNTVSAGLNVHVYDTNYDVDYLLQFYAYFSSNGYANVAYAIYSACAGPGYSCGPAYGNCSIPNCPIAYITIASGLVTDIGKAGDPINLLIYWNSQYGYTFDYMDSADNPYDWTVETLYPSGSYVTMASQGMTLGDEFIWPRNPPVNYAYYLQIGFTMSGIPQNGNWMLDAYNTQYQTTSSSANTYLNHAMTLPFCQLLRCSPEGYYSYWKEVWVVSAVSAPSQGIGINGYGSSTFNSLYIWYSGSPQSTGGDVQLW